MNKILLVLALTLFFSCNKSDEKANREFYYSPKMSAEEEHEMTPSGNYVDLQIKMHSAYVLLKALNTGAISQEEYDKLKKELI